MTEPIVFPMPGYEGLVPPGRPSDAQLEVGRFGDAELRVRVSGSVGGRDCVLIGSVSPPADSLLRVMLSAETLKEHGARQVTAVLPYLAYARSDVPEPGGVQSISLVGRALAVSGVDRAITVDAHSPHAAMLFAIPLMSVSPAGILGAEICKDFELDVVVAPDNGAFPRARALAEALGLEDPMSADQVSDARRALIVDDIIDTGATLSRCSAKLVERGVEEIVVAVTHGIFAGSEWRDMLKLPVRALYTTDTIPDVRRERPYLTRVVAVAPLLERVLHESALVV